MTLHNSSYQHWEGRRLGIWRRRWVIADNGLRACLQGRWMRYLVTVCWVAALAQALALFAIGQMLVPDSWMTRWVGQLNPQLQMFGNALVQWLEDNPQVSVRAVQNIGFYYFSRLLSTFSFLALAVAMPFVITRDLSSNAIVAYSSKAITRFDYFLGKFGTLFGLLCLTWLGPVCAAWALGNLLAPDWHFFWHSRRAAGNFLIYLLISITFLSLLGLGVSALSSRERTASAAWIGIWLLGNGLASLALHTREWLRYFSFSYNLDQVALAVFKLHEDIELLRDSIPVFGQMLHRVNPETMEALRNPAITGAAIGMIIMTVLAILLVERRVRPE
jgi:hypothetical protein